MAEEVMPLIMKSCVILHKIIIENEQDSYDFAFNDDHVEGTRLNLDV